MPAVEVWGQDFHLSAGSFANGQNASPKMIRAPIGKVVAGDAGDDDMLEAEAERSLCDPFGFVIRKGFGMASFNGAKAAGPGADTAENHESGGLSRPAFTAVGALGFRADRFEL